MDVQMATRLSCFALISAIEGDLRGAIRDSWSATGMGGLLPEDVRALCLHRLDRDRKGLCYKTFEPNTDADLLPYVDFADLAKMLPRMGDDWKAVWGSDTHTELPRRLERLAPTRNRVCHSRPLEPGDFADLADAAVWFSERWPGLAVETSTILRKLQADPRFVLGLRVPEFWEAAVDSVTNNLPVAEFDDTGFVGRNRDRRELRKHLSGTHPVVTIVGPGGAGKTALLVRCLYDLLVEGRKQWDAIVWVSLKTQSLTAQGVAEVRGAVTSTLGLLEVVDLQVSGQQRGARSTAEVLTSVQEYLEGLRILLAIDNFETIDESWQELRPLLANVPVGSKVVLTSRRGLGELELRFPLEPLAAEEAARLLRLTARALKVGWLAESTDAKLSRYAERLFFNPLAIRWFVSTLSFGANPDDVLARGGDAFGEVVRFCVESLFGRLEAEEWGVVETLACVRRSVSQTVLQVLCSELGRERLIWALVRLQQASIVESHSRSGGRLEYSLSEIASEYVSSYRRPSADRFRRVREEMRRLDEAVRQRQEEPRKYDVDAVRARSHDERVCASQLVRALEALKAGALAPARALVEHARGLTPSFSEVARVSGMVAAQEGDQFLALTEFERALELEPTSGVSRLTLARFLLDEMDDADRALACIEETLNEGPRDAALLAVRAEALGKLARFGESAELLEGLVRDEGAGQDAQRMAAASAVGVYHAWAKSALACGDRAQAARHLGRAVELMDAALPPQGASPQAVKGLWELVCAAPAMLAPGEGAAREILSRVVARRRRELLALGCQLPEWLEEQN